jgi:AraC-like DNA-binding protein
VGALGQSASRSGVGGIKPLPALQTDELGEACARLSTVFRSHSLQFTRRDRSLSAAHSGISCGAVSFHRLRYGGHVQLLAPEMGSFYLFQIALSGPFRILRNQQTTDVGERQAYAVNPCETFTKYWVPEGDQLIIRIERRALDDYARAILGPGTVRPVAFYPTVVDDAGDALIPLAHYVRCLSAAPVRLTRQIEELAMSTILAAFPSTMSEELDRPARSCAPYYVHRVEEAIDAAPLAEMSVQEMTRVAGVSMRTLYYGFRRFRDTTPLAYLRDRRLDLARSKLMQADPSETTVTSIALECGFTHLAKFASNFRRRFGRTPSSVLRFKDHDG